MHSSLDVEVGAPWEKDVHGLNGTQQASQCGVTVPLLGTPQPQALMAQHGPLAQMETPSSPLNKKHNKVQRNRESTKDSVTS